MKRKSFPIFALFVRRTRAVRGVRRFNDSHIAQESQTSGTPASPAEVVHEPDTNEKISAHSSYLWAKSRFPDLLETSAVRSNGRSGWSRGRCAQGIGNLWKCWSEWKQKH